jgi:hypothetical protein
LKWLLNERAALAGEIQKAKAVVDALQGMRARLEQRIAALSDKEAKARLRAETRQTALNAMDVAIAMESPLVNPAAAGVVSAHAGKYGVHGGLKQYVLQLLETAAPGAVSVSALVQACCLRFAIPLRVPQERRNFRKSVKGALMTLQEHQLIELTAGKAAKGAGVWRYVGARIPTFAEMTEHERKVRAHDPPHTETHTAGPEVAPQRKGRPSCCRRPKIDSLKSGVPIQN